MEMQYTRYDPFLAMLKLTLFTTPLSSYVQTITFLQYFVQFCFFTSQPCRNWHTNYLVLVLLICTSRPRLPPHSRIIIFTSTTIQLAGNGMQTIHFNNKNKN
jgi:hypothetical protein